MERGTPNHPGSGEGFLEEVVSRQTLKVLLLLFSH